MHIWRHLWLEQSRNVVLLFSIPNLLCSVGFQPEIAPNKHLVYRNRYKFLIADIERKKNCFCVLIKGPWEEKILKGSLDLIPSVKIQNYRWESLLEELKAKHLLGVVNKLRKQNVCWHQPVMFCRIIFIKFFCPWFEFSMKVKVTWSNPGYLLKSALR